MIGVPKKRVQTHFKILFDELHQLERDCQILKRWTGMKRQASGRKLALLLEDSLEAVVACMLDLRNSCQLWQMIEMSIAVKENQIVL